MVRLLFVLVFGLAAIAAQLLALALLASSSLNETSSLLALLGWQALAAFSAALFFAHCQAGKSREYRSGVFLLAFFLCLFLPVGGQLLFLGMTLAPFVMMSTRLGAGLGVVEPPEFTPSLVSRVSYGTAARLKRRLGNRTLPDQDRVAAMIAMRSLPLRYTRDMLAGLLSDPLEEIRLLAYGISTAAETSVTQKILATSRALDVAEGQEQEERLNSELAELHWELNYQKIVQGELSRHALERVERHAHVALALDESNAATWCLLGRCALLRREPLQAEFFLLNAQKRQFPALRLLPWLAEAAFMKGEYERIEPMLAELRDGPVPPVLQPTLRYWTQ